nr:signal peptidase II [Williamsia sp. CHRR-6]
MRGGRRPGIVSLLPLVAGVTLILDLVTKMVVVATIKATDPIEIIGDTVTLTQVRNSGAAFSLATGYTWVLTIVALIVVGVIIRFANRLRSAWWAVGLGLILGGALGNLIDRIFRSPGPLRGHVVDFISVGWWPVFNIADSAVVCGAVLLVALTLFGVELDGTRTPSGRSPKTESDSAAAASNIAGTPEATTPKSPTPQMPTPKSPTPNAATPSPNGSPDA